MANDAAVARYGLSALEMTMRDILPPEEVPAFLESVANGRDGRIWRHRLNDGRIVFAETSSHAFDLEGRCARLVMALDVTERLAAEQKIRESEELFRAVSNVTADVIWEWNVVTDKIWWSEGLKDIFCHSPEESRRNLEFWKAHIHPDDLERVLRSTVAAIESGEQTWEDQYRFFRGDGSVAHVEDSGYIIYDRQGRPVRFVGGMTDVSARMEAEVRLAQQAALLDMARDAIIVHDVEHRILFWNKAQSESTGGRRRKQSVNRLARCFMAVSLIPSPTSLLS